MFSLVMNLLRWLGIGKTKEIDLRDYCFSVNEADLELLKGKEVTFATENGDITGKIYKHSFLEVDGYSFVWWSKRKDMIHHVSELYPHDIDQNPFIERERERIRKEYDGTGMPRDRVERWARLVYPDTSRIFKTGAGKYFATNIQGVHSTSPKVCKDFVEYLNTDVMDLQPAGSE